MQIASTVALYLVQWSVDVTGAVAAADTVEDVAMACLPSLGPLSGELAFVPTKDRSSERVE